MVVDRRGCVTDFGSRAAVPLTIRFDAPASDWEREALPIGNGAIGAMIVGGVAKTVCNSMRRRCGRVVPALDKAMTSAGRSAPSPLTWRESQEKSTKKDP